MYTETVNLYEQVFESWLREQKIAYECVAQIHRVRTSTQSIKNFDYLLRPESPSPVLTELKGRTFQGSSLAGMKGLDGWVTYEDVQSLFYWQRVFQPHEPRTRAVFVFAFRFRQIDIETDGMDVYDWGGERFLFLAIPLKKYMDSMKIRSPKWQTVVLPADDFREWAVPIKEMLQVTI